MRKNLLSLAVFSLLYSGQAAAQCTITDQTVSASVSSIVCSGASSILVGSSQTGVNYYLRNNATGLVVGGPIAGTGNPINFSTGVLTSTTQYNVFATNPSRAIQLNGTSQFVRNTTPTGLPSGSVVTVEAWVYPTGYPDGTYNGVVSFGARNCTPLGQSFLLSMTSAGRPSMATWCNDFVPNTGPTATLNAWNHIACVLNGTSVRLYLNGFEWSGTLASLPNIQPSGFALNIGSTDNPGRYFQGRIDEVRIWNTALSAAQVEANRYACISAPQPGLVSYFRFEEGAGTTIADQAGTNTLSLVNAPTWSTAGSDVCAACNLTLSTTPTVTVNALSSQTITPATATICPNNAVNVVVGASQAGMVYYLRNSSNTVVDGGDTGNGGTVNFSTGSLTSSETFNVFASTPNRGLDFDGTNDFLNGNNDPEFDITGDVTIETWVYLDATPTDWVRLAGKGVSSSSQRTYGLWITPTTNQPLFQILGSGTGNLTAPALALNTWYHIAGVRSGNTMNFYTNGVLVATTTYTGTAGSTTAPFTVGYAGFHNYFDGKMDEVRLWNVARTASEIRDGMNNCATGNESGLVACYNFEEGTGSTIANDLSPNANTLTLTNMNAATAWVAGVSVCGSCNMVMPQTVAVTVQDLAPTVATSPSNLTVNTSAGTCGAAVTYTAPTFNDVCDGNGLAGTLVSGLASGSTFPIGVTTVQYSYTDAASQTVNTSFTVTVVDNEAPQFSNCPANITVPADNAGCTAVVSWIAPSVSDNCNATPAFNSSHASGATFAEGTTTVTYTANDGNGNTSTCSFTVTVENTLQPSSTENMVSCFGGNDGSIDVTVTGGTAPITYSWSGPSSFASTDEDINNLIAGSYSATATDANGCSISGVIVITEPSSAVSVVVSSSSNPSGCGVNDGTADITVSGGTVAGAYDILWTDGSGFTSASEDQNTLLAGVYSVTVTDDNSCTATVSVSLSDPNGPTVALDGASVLAMDCFGDTDGDIQIDVTLNGGATGATYLWDDAGATTSEDLSGVGAGVYTIEVEDNNGCIATLAVTVTQPSQITITSTVSNVSCNGANDGEVDIQVSGGTVAAVYDYNWNSGAVTTEDISGLGAGSVSVVVTDDNGCSATQNYTITEPAVLSASGTSSDEINGNDGSVNLTITGGTSTYSVAWTGPGGFSATTEDISGLVGGTYNATITDANGCTTTASVVVSSQVSVEELAQFSLEVYPNPGNGIFIVRLNATAAATIRVLDATGRLVLSKDQINTISQIDMSAMESGIYFFQVMQAGQVKTVRVILQK